MNMQHNFLDTNLHGFKLYDRTLLIIVSILFLLGLVMVFSSTVGALNLSINEEVNFKYMLLQSIYLFIGIIAMLFVSMISIDFWFANSRVLLCIGIFMLAIVLIPGIGIEVNYSRRWISLGLFRLQPSELVKVFVIIYLASFICRIGDNMKYFKIGVISPGIVLGIMSVLLLMQPDFGTTFVLISTAGIMLFLGGIKLIHAFLIMTVGAIFLSVMALASPYRVKRLMTFTDPWLDPYGDGYQISQAFIAMGRGEWFGVGLGNSIQKFYLPHAHNDFIFVLIGEEIGFVGLSIIVLLFIALIYRIFHLAKIAEEVNFIFGSRLCQGLGTLIAIQTIIHMGVNLGLLPTKGLTLPFFSYGGSSIVVTCVIIGILLAISKQIKVLSYQRSEKIKSVNTRGSMNVK